VIAAATDLKAAQVECKLELSWRIAAMSSMFKTAFSPIGQWQFPLLHLMAAGLLGAGWCSYPVSPAAAQSSAAAAVPLLVPAPTSSQVTSPPPPTASPTASPLPLGRPLPVKAEPTPYFIGPGDELKITVVGYPEYTGTQVVLSDGTIALPLVGNVMAADRTPSQLTADLSTQLDKYLVKPVVAVNISTLRPITINVSGEVQHPGPIQLRSVTTASGAIPGTTSAGVVTLQRPTVTTALLEAGGITREADLRRVTLRRFSPSSTLLASRPEPININLWDAITTDAPARDLVLQDGDTLFIPKLAANDVDKLLMARSSIAPRTVRVKVVGEVKKPGEILVPPDGSLSSAIAIAGGPTEKARMKEVSFIRIAENGKAEQKTLDLRTLSDSIQVQDGDVILVPQTAADRGLTVANQVVSPLGLILRLFGIR
jgi:polysaccharide biosynthesis/export protein